MGIPVWEYRNIIKDNPLASAQTNAIVNAWIQRGEASWATLVRALRDPLVEQLDIANKIAEQHPSKKNLQS